MAREKYDAIVIGSGPNGLSAAIALAQAGHSVQVVEAHETIGGGCRTLPLTLPGFRHDMCSSIHPMAVTSPFWRELPLAEHGLDWVFPPTPCAHPFDDGTAAALEKSVDATAETLGDDGPAYRKRVGRLVDIAEDLFRDLLGPLRLPRHPIAALKFGRAAVKSVQSLADSWFTGPKARALMAGLGGHAVLPLDHRPGAAIALMLGLAAHVVGWPSPRGGAQTLADALASYFRSLGGEIIVGRRVDSLAELPPSRVVLFDLAPKQILKLAGDRFTDRYRRKLDKFHYGPGVYKIDYALHEPIPWTAEACRRAGTVHVGGTFEEIAASEAAAWNGRVCDKPYLIVTQPGRFDPTRAPAGQTTAWAYCHVPNSSTADMAGPIEAQLERFAPGFRE
ncbi:MAG TPA: NAD(P)/FAD-dependent oxidoreductase, partial [Gemmataceae bacterium]|nr:NAD(P)/FAD-dependent oxidoreductase [Gemmataceae bacterium]